MQDAFCKVRLLNDESLRWLYTQGVKLHLSNTQDDEIGIEKECKILQNTLNSASNESLGAIERRSRRKYLKIQDGQIKQLIETKKKIL